MSLSANLQDNLRFVSSVLCTFIRVTNCLLFPYVCDYKVIIHSVFGLCGLSDLWHHDKYLCSQHPHYGTLCIQFSPGPPTVITGLSQIFTEFISDLTWDSSPAAHISSIVCHVSKCIFVIPCKSSSVAHSGRMLGHFCWCLLPQAQKHIARMCLEKKLLFCLRPLLLSCVSSPWSFMRNVKGKC